MGHRPRNEVKWDKISSKREHMKKQTLSILIILLVLGTACSASPSISKQDQLATIVAGTLSVQPVFTPIPTLTATIVPTVVTNSVVTISGPYYIYTRAQNVNLRTQPGTLFPVSRVMAERTRLQVLGLSPGEEWAYVINDEGINGWVDITFVDEFPKDGFLIVQPQDSQLVSGRVLTPDGRPVNGIGFALVQTNGSKTMRTDAATDVNGVFYAYLPKTASGVWTVGYVSIEPTSNAMNSNCSSDVKLCGQPQPESTNITLPVIDQLNFVWK
jgi:hypothetical protein